MLKAIRNTFTMRSVYQLDWCTLFYFSRFT
jgi:hypothetical protein